MTADPDPSSALDEHLQREAHDGRLVDQGEMTLNPAKALEKLGQFSLPQPGYWVLKIVQAAVAAHAPEIRFKFLRGRVEIFFENRADWEAKNLLSTMLRGEIASNRALAHFQAGLMAAVGDGNESVTWSCGGHLCRFASDSLTSETRETDGGVWVVALRSRRRMTFAQKKGLPLRHVIRQTALEYKALIDRCVRSPIPIVLDSRELARRYAVNHREVLPHSREAPGEGSGMLLAVKALSGPVEREPLPYGWETRKEPTPESFSTLYFPDEGMRVVAVLCVLRGQNKESELVTVHDGVTLDKVDLFAPEFATPLSKSLRRLLRRRAPFSLSLCVAVRPEHVDLSHFGVRREGEAELFPVIREELPLIFEALRARCLLPWEFTQVAPPNPFSRDISFGDCATITMLVPFIPFFAFTVPIISPIVRGVEAYDVWRHPEHSAGNRLAREIDPILKDLEKLDVED